MKKQGYWLLIGIISFLITIMSDIFLFSPSKVLGEDLERYVVVEKSTRRVSLYRGGRLVAVFPCSLGLDAESPKREKGDMATPEGLYRVYAKHPSRNYYLFIELDYPNLKDIFRARWEGRISEKEFKAYLEARWRGKIRAGSLGYAVGLHGGGLFRGGGSRSLRDWTHGCIALRNKDIRKVYSFVRIGTPVLIYDRRRPLVETLEEIVPLRFRPRELEGRVSFSFPGIGLGVEIFFSEKKNGLRRLEMVGRSLSTGKMLFYIRDLNGNGRLDPLDSMFSRVEAWPGGYAALQTLVIDDLPRQVLNLLKENSGEWSLVEDGDHHRYPLHEGSGRGASGPG